MPNAHIRSKFSVILRKVRLVVVRTYYLQSANHGDIEMLSKTSLVGRVYFSQTYLHIGFAKPLGEVSKHCLETSPRGPLVEVQCVLFDSGRLLPRLGCLLSQAELSRQAVAGGGVAKIAFAFDIRENGETMMFSLHCLVRQCHLSCQALPSA